MTVDKTGAVSESLLMKLIIGITVPMLIWSGTTILNLSNNDGLQELHIQKGIETDKETITNHGLLRDRVTRLEADISGLKTSINNLTKNIDWMRNRMEKEQ